MRNLLTALIIIFFSALLGSCAPKKYTAIQAYMGKDGEIRFVERKFTSLDKCRKKAKRIKKRRSRVKDHNPNYGITSMGGARQRR